MKNPETEATLRQNQEQASASPNQPPEDPAQSSQPSTAPAEPGQAPATSEQPQPPTDPGPAERDPMMADSVAQQIERVRQRHQQIDAAVQAIYGMRTTFLIRPDGHVDLTLFCNMLLAYIHDWEPLEPIRTDVETLIQQVRQQCNTAPSNGYSMHTQQGEDDLDAGQTLTGRIISLIRANL